MALIERSFIHKDKSIQVKIIPSSVEPSFQKHKEVTQNFLSGQIRSLSKTTDIVERRALEKQIKCEQKEIEEYDRLIKQDERHNKKVAKLNGVEPGDAWNKVAIHLKEQYQNQKKAVKKLLEDELVDVFIDGSRIDYEQFIKITKDMTRIEYILKELTRYEYEFEEYCIRVKLIDSVTV